MPVPLVLGRDRLGRVTHLETHVALGTHRPRRKRVTSTVRLMIDVVSRELADDPTVDITTTGARSGELRRIEIWMLDVGGRYYITGTPGRRDWLGNPQGHPALTVPPH